MQQNSTVKTDKARDQLQKQATASAGFACYHVDRCRTQACCHKQVYVLLLRNKGGYWDFAKGCEEKCDGGDLLKTAYRELKEETGLLASDINPLTPAVFHMYEYRVGDKLKRVKLFLAQLNKSIFKKAVKLRYDSNEIFSHRFVPLRKLHTYFFWKEDKEVARAIQQTLLRMV